MKTIIENASCVELIDKLITIGTRNVKHYKTDIAHDIEYIVKHNDDKYNDGYYWSVRSCGTWLFTINNNYLEHVENILNNNYTEYKLYKISRCVNLTNCEIEYTMELIKTVREN